MREAVFLRQMFYVKRLFLKKKFLLLRI